MIPVTGGGARTIISGDATLEEVRTLVARARDTGVTRILVPLAG